METIEFDSFLNVQIDSVSRMNQEIDFDSILCTTVPMDSMLNKIFIKESPIDLEEI